VDSGKEEREKSNKTKNIKQSKNINTKCRYTYLIKSCGEQKCFEP